MLNDEEKKLKPYEWAIVGWPFLMVFVGGLIGGALGGGAVAINLKIIKMQKPLLLRALICFAIGLLAIASYIIIVLALGMAFPSFFNPQ